MKLGVIVGRFQVARLHQGHKDLIEYALAQCTQVLVVLGSARSYPTERNPLSFETRKAMMIKLFPGVQVAKLHDHPSDECWSEQLDKLIQDEYKGYEVTLYGSRDSFLEVYSGSYPVELFPVRNDCSGTDRRRQVVNRPRISEDFLAGIIYREAIRPPIVYPAVDTAVIREDRQEVLLASKSTDGGKLRFIGGFVDETDVSYETAAKREVMEETSYIEVDDFHYLGSAKIDDWRYRGVRDGIMTTLFRATYIFGAPIPKDDIERLEWVPIAAMMEMLIPEHRPLGEMLLRSFQK